MYCIKSVWNWLWICKVEFTFFHKILYTKLGNSRLVELEQAYNEQ